MVDADSIRNCGICCGGFSIFACIFLLSVGGIISSGSEIIDLPHDKDRNLAANTCYYAALIYFVTMLLSIGCFFGPMFLKRNADLDALRSRSGASSTGRRGRPDDL